MCLFKYIPLTHWKLNFHSFVFLFVVLGLWHLRDHSATSWNPLLPQTPCPPPPHTHMYARNLVASVRRVVLSGKKCIGRSSRETISRSFNNVLLSSSCIYINSELVNQSVLVRVLGVYVLCSTVHCTMTLYAVQHSIGTLWVLGHTMK